MSGIDVEMALEFSSLVHAECKDVPHDIGLKLAEIVAQKTCFSINQSNPVVAALIKIAELYENNQMRSNNELGSIAYDMRCIARNALEKLK